jgi:hypothetical protein
MEMRHRNAHRGLAALVTVLALAFAGARPAAAAEPSPWQRLEHVWSTAVAGPSLWEQMTSWLTGSLPAKSTSVPTSTTDKGWGMDPNGQSAPTNPTVTPVGTP